jgi:hypothetical protein
MYEGVGLLQFHFKTLVKEVNAASQEFLEKNLLFP